MTELSGIKATHPVREGEAQEGGESLPGTTGIEAELFLPNQFQCGGRGGRVYDYYQCQPPRKLMKELITQGFVNPATRHRKA